MFRFRTLKAKLLGMSIVTTGTALVAACSVMAGYDYVVVRRALVTDTRTYANIIAGNSTAAISFGDDKDASQILGSLQAEKHIVSASVFDASGKRLATYLRDPNAAAPNAVDLVPGAYCFSGDTLEVSCPVEMNGQVIGSVFVRSDLDALRALVRGYVFVMIVVILGAMVIATSLKRRVIKVILGSLQHLSVTAEQISTQRNYAMRAKKTSDDELGTLVDCFNTMLDQIQERDGQLQYAKENAERESRARGVILDTAMDAIVTFDAENAVSSWNPQAVAMFGWEKEEAIGLKIDEAIIAPEYRAAYLRTVNGYRTSAPGPLLNNRIEIIAKRRTGEEFPAELSITPAETQGGYLFTAFIRDITERKQAENERHRLTENIRLLLDSTGEGIYGIDVFGNCSFVNNAAAKLLGYSVEEMLGQNMHHLVHHHHPDGSAYDASGCPIARSFKEGTHCRVDDEVFWRRDGAAIPVEYSAFPIRSGAKVLGSVVTFADITERKRAEAELLKAKEGAESASLAKSEFLARMSHEIRTPLNGVVGMIDLLAATELSDAQQRYARLARTSADALLSVISDILDFSKIEAGKVEIEATEFDLRELLETLIEMLSPAAAKKRLELACFLRPDVPARLIGDPTRIRQVLTNLINNALKFTSKGCVSVCAVVDRVEPDGVVIRVDVEDTGIGVPADRLTRLFKSFSQVDTSTTRKFGGTGLGLAISKALVELMGGEIGVHSQEGKGTTFWFTIKLRQVQINHDLPAPGRSAEFLRNVRVLVAESEPLHRRILSQHLEGWLSASSAIVPIESARDLMRQAAAEGKPFAVALISCGNEQWKALVADIQAEPPLRATKLVGMLDIDDRSDGTIFAQSGFFARLHRPLTQSRVLDTIASATVQRPARQNAANAAPEKASRSAALKGLHLLVAEDNEMNQFVTQETLSRAGCTCDIVADGALAVEAVQRHRYDAVLMDCQMPGMDGLEATRLIRQREAATVGSRRVPIIALTADAIQGDREKCLAAGMDDYVTKPIELDALFTAIGGVMKAASIADAAPKPPAPPANPADHPVIAKPEASPPALEKPIDIEALLARCMSDVGFVRMTLEKFQQRAIEDVELLRRGAAAGDAGGVKRLAHKLKSVAAHVAAGPLRKIVFEIEQAGARQDLEFITRQLAILDEEARRCVAFIPGAIAAILPAPANVEPSGPAAVKGEAVQGSNKKQ
jgi:PAS domain S-box-containing protein